MTQKNLSMLLKDELITNFVYTFTPTGDLKELPIDSSIIDFAYSIHSDIEIHATEEKLMEPLYL